MLSVFLKECPQRKIQNMTISTRFHDLSGVLGFFKTIELAKNGFQMSAKNTFFDSFGKSYPWRLA